jgi:hypothetical protein
LRVEVGSDARRRRAEGGGGQVEAGWERGTHLRIGLSVGRSVVEGRRVR